MGFLFYELYIVFILSGIIIIISLIYCLCFKKKEKTKKMIITNQLEDINFYYCNNTFENNSKSQLITKIIKNDKLLQEQFYEAQYINTQSMFINYITNPIPTYEELFQDSKIERPTLTTTPIHQFDTEDSNDYETSVIVPIIPVRNNQILNNNNINIYNNIDLNIK